MEESVVSPVAHRAEALGWFPRKLAWRGRDGAPDYLFIKDGRVVFIEFKDRGKKARLNQSREHDRMRAAGAEVHVVDNVYDGLKILGLV